MKDRVESTISILLRARKRRRRWVVLLLVLAILAVAGPFYAFRMNAIAKTHQKRVLVCAAESGAVSHIHNDDCYLNGVLVCQLEEIECCAANYLQLLKSDYPQLNKEKSVGLFKI